MSDSSSALLSDVPSSSANEVVKIKEKLIVSVWELFDDFPTELETFLMIDGVILCHGGKIVIERPNEWLE